MIIPSKQNLADEEVSEVSPQGANVSTSQGSGILLTCLHRDPLPYITPSEC